MTGVDEASTLGVLVGILAALVSVIVLLVRGARDAKEAAYHAQQANHAVNQKGTGEPTISENVAYLVEQQRKFESKGWNSLPADIGDAPALTSKIRGLEHNDQEIERKVDNLTDLLREHDRWERKQKYREGGNT